MAMIRELFGDLIRASEILDRDHEFRTQLRSTVERLVPYGFGSDGSLKEWYRDWTTRLGEPLKSREMNQQVGRKHGASTSGPACSTATAHINSIENSSPTSIRWPTGSVSGIRARGGFEVDIEWREGVLTGTTIRAKGGTECRPVYGAIMRDLELRPGEELQLNRSLR